MTAGKRDVAGIEALQQMLDTYGGEPSRWPAGARERFQPLLAGDAAARSTMAASHALDTILSQAPAVPAARRIALAERIVSEALAAQADRPRGEVIDLSARRVAARGVPPRPTPMWQAAAVLAASLMLGVFAGISGELANPLDDIASLAGVGGDNDALSVALNHAVDTTVEEDPL